MVVMMMTTTTIMMSVMMMNDFMYMIVLFWHLAEYAQLHRYVLETNLIAFS